MSRRPIIAGNWKMNKTLAQAKTLATELKRTLARVRDVDIVLAPPFVLLQPIAKLLEDTNIGLGAQNIHQEEAGAYTGEISGPMLSSVGCRYVIVGHSERRQYFGETDELVCSKVQRALLSGLTPIVCIGESLGEREGGETFNRVRTQLTRGLEGFTAAEVSRMVLAYEPIWAIGTGRTATPQQAQEVHEFIRHQLTEMFGSETAHRVCIQYGGSVKPDNIDQLMAQADIDGALVGGASLDAESFDRIVKYRRTGEDF